jgi:uncharacterized protein YciI
MACTGKKAKNEEQSQLLIFLFKMRDLDGYRSIGCSLSIRFSRNDGGGTQRRSAQLSVDPVSSEMESESEARIDRVRRYFGYTGAIMRLVYWIALPILCLSLTASTDQPWPPPGAECGESVLAHYNEGPKFANAAQVYPEHTKYIGELLRQGKIAAAGRMRDANRALIIARTKDLAEAQAWVNEDPFVRNGVVKATFEVWGHCWAVGVAAPDLVPPKAQ